MSDLLLEIVEGPQAGTKLPLDGSIELGRDPSLSTPLDDAKISRHHARVTGSGRSASLEDLGSTNGTFLNESPLETPTALRLGDRIRVGLTVLELRSAAEQARGSAVAPVPVLTQVGADVLNPVPTRELAEVHEPEPEYGAVRAQSQEPHYVSSGVANRIEGFSPQGESADADYAAVQRLADNRVKARTNVAAFALIAIALLAVVIYFGVTT